MALKNKILLTAGLLACTAFSFSAITTDDGKNKKKKNSVLLDLKPNTTLRNNIVLSLKSGLRYTGSQNTAGNTRLSTYQKGNTVYIVPQKKTILVPEYKQGYTGLKLIITKKG